MNRKISNLVPHQAQQIAGNLGYRLPTAFDQEREEFEKSQSNAMTKSLSLIEAAPKEKHVRTLILGTYQNRGADIFWHKLTSNVPLFGNEIVTWKFCVVFHRLMQDGDAKVISGSIKHCSLIDEVCRSHTSQKSSYGELVGQYGKLILDKLLFHNKNKMVPGNFAMKHTELENIDAGDMFELGVDFLDQMETTVVLMRAVFNTFEIGNKSLSLTKEGQCRLAALIPCTHDTSRLLELTTSLMRLLHIAVPWDALSGHRSRFGELHSKLRRLYDEMSNLMYLKSMVQIPRLSEDLAVFFETLHNISTSENKAGVAEADEFEIQSFDQRDELISVADESVDASMAYIQQEYSDLSSKYQMVLQMLEAEQNERAKAQVQHQSRERSLEEQLESLRQQFNEFTAANSTSTAAEATSEAGKLEKLKSAYQKLRTDHIATLRLKGDTEKSLHQLKADYACLETQTKASESTLIQFFQDNGIEYSSNDKEALSRSLRTLREKLDTLQVSLVSKDAAIRSLEEAKEEQEKLDQEAFENKELQAEIERLQSDWQTENRWKSRKFLAVLQDDEDEATAFLRDGGGGGSAVDLESTKEISLATSDRLISILLLTLARLLPHAGGDDDEGVNMSRLNELAFCITESLLAGDESYRELWPQFQKEATHQLSNVEKLNAKASVASDDLDVEGEIRKMQSSISEAAATMEKLMVAARANEAKKKDIDVDIKILDSCSLLLQAIEMLIKAAKELQEEITAESGAIPKDFYRKNHKWSAGLVTVAKDIGSFAKCLVDTADGVLAGAAKFEELIVASQEIAASTAQMVLTSRVKARKQSEKLLALSTRSKAVSEATATVIATCRASAIQKADEDNKIDLMSLSVHQSKRLEMEVQIRVLELEALLEKQRKKLFDIRKHQYAQSSEASQSTTKNQDT